MKPWWLALILVGGGNTMGCDDTFVERGIQARFELNGGFWEQPLPNATRAGQLDEDQAEAQGSLFEAAQRLVGVGFEDGAIVVPLSGEALQRTLPEPPSLGRNSSVFLMDIDLDSPERGLRLPIEVTQLNSEDAGPVGPGLLIEPMEAASRANTLYAVVLTDSILGTQNSRLGRSEDFHDAFEDNNDRDPALRDLLLELRAALVADQVELQTIANAAIFTSPP